MILSVKNLIKKFKFNFWEKEFFALNDVSFDLQEGELIGFLGANGAGKTTTIKIILDFISSNSGEVHFSKKMGRGKSVFKRIGYMPERPYYYPYLTGMEFLKYCGKLQGMDSNRIKERSLNLANKLKIDHAINRKINSYSKGMLQRLGFASVLLHDPDLIILDEPLSGLDPVGRKEFKDILVELNNAGKTVFFSSHIVSDVEEICSSVVVLEKGKLIYNGSIEKLVEDNIKPIYRFIVNSNSEFKIKHNSYLKFSNKNVDTYEVEASEKDRFLLECLEAKVEVIHFSQEKISLEEVVYKIRDNNE